MKKFLNLTGYSVKKFIIIYYVIGLIGLSIPFTGKYFVYLTPFSILMNLFLILYFNLNWGARFIVCGLLIYILSMTAEIIGVNTGIIFGIYTYESSTLGPRLLNTPLIIGINWFILIYCIFIFINKFKFTLILRILMGGLLMLIFDILLEPVAGKMLMWSWLSADIPLLNYASWFIMACAFMSIMYLVKINIQNVISTHLLLVQFMFFAALNLFL